MDLNVYASDEFQNGGKKRNVSHAINNKEKFAPGAIMRVKLKNFVVYAITEFILSPSLNMIIAPNGTGKSTFVCAVCLGLAGHPSLLGRQKVVSEFIKNGETSATIEITLKNKGDEPDLVIRRIIYSNNKSDWAINNKNVSEPKVKAVLADLNVQLDNLCQFLPQEKVADFSKLSQEELLMETQRAVDIEMMNQHKKLIELDAKKDEVTTQLAGMLSEKEHLETERARFEEEARKYEAYQKKKAELEEHLKLLPIAELQDMKAEANRLKEERIAIEREIATYEAEMAPFEEARHTVAAEVDEFMNASKDKMRENEQLERDLAAAREKLDKYDDRIAQTKSKLEGLSRNAEQKRKQYEEKLQENARDEEQLAKIELADEEKMKEWDALADKNHNEQSVYEDRAGELGGNVNRLKNQMAQIEKRREDAKRQLTSKDNIGLLRNGPYGNDRTAQEAYKAVQVLRHELSDIHHEIFEPPLLTVSAKPGYAHFLAELVSRQNTLALTAVSQEAFNKHSHKILEARSINAPMRYLGGKQLHPQFSTEQLRSFGFDGYLKDFVVGPAPVIQMLCETSYIHDVPVALKPLSDQQIERLRKGQNGGPVFKKFFSGDTMFNLSQSRYGSRQVIMRTQHVNTKTDKFTGSGLSDDMKASINRQVADFEKQLQEMHAKLNDYRHQRDEAKTEAAKFKTLHEKYRHLERGEKEKKNARTKIETRMDLRKKTMKKLKEEANKDHSEEIQLHHQRLKKMAVERISTVCDIADMQSKYNEGARSVTLLKVQHFEKHARKLAVDTLFQSIIHQKEELDMRLAQAKRRIQELNRDGRKKELKREVDTYSQDLMERLSSHITKYAEEGRFTRESMLEVIASIEAEVLLLNTHSKSSVTTLEKINDKLDDLNVQIPELEREKKMVLNDLTEIHDAWSPKVFAMAQKISAKFSEIFPTVGIAGEVQVKRADHFKDWKMEILVKFRESAELKALDSHTQSGGERAVSTVYYMISMQELTVSPFRVVDEINQGMDARNERIVHKNMVEIACQEHTSQYFLITPKLLTNLHYLPQMRIHCIMAGPWTPDPKRDEKFLTLGMTSVY